MANKRYDQFTAGASTADKIILIADPATGELKKVSIANFNKISYQNSAMSSAVDCYIQYKADGTTPAAVYEPVRNNYVRLHTYADNFPFDNTDCYNNTLNDVDLIDVASDVIIQGSELSTMVINGNSHTGFFLRNNVLKGAYGVVGPSANGAEVYVTGDRVTISACVIATAEGQSTGWFLDSIGDDGYIVDVGLITGFNGVYFNSKTGIYFGDCLFKQDGSYINFHYNNSSFYDFSIGGGCEIHVPSSTDNSVLDIGDFIRLGTADFGYKKINCIRIGSNNTTRTIKPTVDNMDTLLRVDFGLGITYTTSGDITDAQFLNIAGTVYRLGVIAGAVTATPV